MLVLSRRIDEKICFPALGITVHILGLKGSAVKVGVDAPLEIRVVRDELQDEPSKEPAKPRSHVIQLPPAAKQELRKQMNSVGIALQLFRKQTEAGKAGDADLTFDHVVKQLERIATGELEPKAKPPAEPKEDSARRCRALLVEDQDNEREMLAGILRMKGYDVVTASDGIEALQYLQENESPDVVLIDMRMPRQDGPTTIRQIRADHRFDATKVFAISGSDPSEVGVDTQRDGVNRWFQKPLNPRKLIDALIVDSAFTASDKPASTIA